VTESAFYVDKMSAFNIRPPELSIFDNPVFYHECFVTSKATKFTVSADIVPEAWFRRCGYAVLVWSCSVDKYVEYLHRRFYQARIVLINF
jgi:hypothetical protein